MSPSVASKPGWSWLLGRSFVHPLFDYLVIGGGLSLLVVAAVVRIDIVTVVLQWVLGPNVTVSASSLALTASIPTLVLLSNSAHFAASTVRLYTKPGAFKDLPFLTMVFPLITLVALTLSIALVGVVGRHLDALYLTWSPFHYAAQAYGLAVMYCYRSGCALGAGEKRLLWWSCMLPFFFSFVGGYQTGLEWFVPASAFSNYPLLHQSRVWLVGALAWLIFAVPIALFLVAGSLRLFRRTAPIPLISLLLVVTNGIWWTLFNYLDAFVWATIFHGVQYLGIVTIFHVKDQSRLPTNRHGWLVHSVKFYAMCLVLGYGLFHCWPRAYVLAGYSLAESMPLVIAMINIHHFVVDAYIWRLRKDPNYRNVTDATMEPA